MIGVSSDPLLGIEDVATLRPDVVLADRFVSIADGLVVARHLYHDAPHAGIVLRSPWPHADRHDAVRGGLRSVVDVEITVPDLARALLAAAKPATPR